MKLYVVGIGPGESRQMTPWAQQVLAECDLLVGYKTYIDLVIEQYPHKEVLSTGMTQEKERACAALQAAAGGKTVAVVCSGDAGVYGMAGLIYELSPEYPPVEIEVVPGVTAASAGAALLGAPLMHDFAVISLSDLLTPWEQIEQKLLAAAATEFVLCLYNPSSRKRADYLRRACELVLQHRAGNTVCGWAKHIGRTGEDYKVMTLEELKEESVDMFTTVFIGNSTTQNIGGKMVTARGYRV